METYDNSTSNLAIGESLYSPAVLVQCKGTYITYLSSEGNDLILNDTRIVE